MQTPDVRASSSPIIGGSGADPNSNDARLKKACQEFEGQFFDLMLQEMRKTIPKDTLLGDDGHTQEIFTGMMDEQVAQEMAKQGGANDLASEIYKQLAERFDQPSGKSGAQSAAPDSVLVSPPPSGA